MRTKKLKAADLKTLAKPGRYSDGGGLYFFIGSKGERKFTFRYKSRTARYSSGDPKVHELGLGGAPPITTPITAVAASLAEARRSADHLAGLLKAKQDPLTERRKRAPRSGLTFGEFADTYVAGKISEFKNPVHVKQWIRSFKVQAAALRDMPIQDVDTAAVLSVLRPIWTATPESAKRLQERIEKVLNAAAVEGHRDGANPARWKDHLKETLATRKQADKKNHAAMPVKEMPAFMAELRALTSVSARALEYTVLTAARTGETTGATWAEIDLAEGVWTVPAHRMKKSKVHRVPLTARSVELLSDLRKFSATGPDDFVFQNGARKGLSSAAMSECLKGLRKGVTVHGMRSAFSDWANDTTQHDRQVIEFALSHIIGDKAEAAYRRGDAFEKRRLLLADWETYLSQNKTPGS